MSIFYLDGKRDEALGFLTKNATKKWRFDVFSRKGEIT
jgi:hypothetical protein